MKTTKILSINVGNCQRIFENLKIDDNVLASSPVQTKKSLKSTRSKGGRVSMLQSWTGAARVTACGNQSAGEEPAREQIHIT